MRLPRWKRKHLKLLARGTYRNPALGIWDAVIRDLNRNYPQIHFYR